MPDFCKLDVEGYESRVLEGVSRPLPMVSFEFAPEYLRNALDCIDRLQGLGQVRFNFSVGETMELAQPDWITAPEMVRTLEALPDPMIFGDVYARCVSPS
jgi:hypothetical protein